MDLGITTPIQADEQPNELTQLEIADLTDKKRGTILYERMISDLKNRVEELNGRINNILQHNDLLIAKDSQHQDEIRENGAMRRSAVETTISFTLATLFMTVGGALISSYPMADKSTPWQFAFGWSAIICGFVFGITSRALAWLVIRLQRGSKNA